MFEIIEKRQIGPVRVKHNEISVYKTGFSFGKDCLNLLDKDFVEIYIDRKDNRIGFKPTNNSITGFKINRKDTLRINCVFSKKVVKRKYNFIIEDDMIIIESVLFIKEDKEVKGLWKQKKE